MEEIVCKNNKDVVLQKWFLRDELDVATRTRKFHMRMRWSWQSLRNLPYGVTVSLLYVYYAVSKLETSNTHEGVYKIANVRRKAVTLSYGVSCMVFAFAYALHNPLGNSVYHQWKTHYSLRTPDLQYCA